MDNKNELEVFEKSNDKERIRNAEGLDIKVDLFCYNNQRRGTARTLHNFCVALCNICFVLFSVLFVCVYVYCTTATGWLPNCSYKYIISIAEPSGCAV